MQFEKILYVSTPNCIFFALSYFIKAVSHSKIPSMKKTISFFVIFFMSLSYNIFAQQSPVAEVYLITCSPGTETYSIYGHSALRIIDHENGTDYAYNWGVFDFAAPHFVWKFAKGKLEYMLGVYSIDRFLQDYFMEKRSVYQQKINLEPGETETLLALITENLKPENRKYRYDFLYDNCATRIRDLLEKSTGGKLFYPSETERDIPTFRTEINKYQRPYPWLQFGIDLLLGTPVDKKAGLRDRMFLPLEMQKGLSEALVNRNGKYIPLLQNPSTLLEFDPPEIKKSWIISPMFVFSIILIAIIVFSATQRGRTTNKIFDIVVFSVFSLLAVLILFFSFVSDHQQTKWNLNIIWLSPFIIMCLISILLGKEWHISFKVSFFLALLAFTIQIVFPNVFNSSFITLELLIAIRCSMRAGFSWNPLTIHLTEV
jgi:hypothetical protein